MGRFVSCFRRTNGADDPPSSQISRSAISECRGAARNGWNDPRNERASDLSITNAPPIECPPVPQWRCYSAEGQTARRQSSTATSSGSVRFSSVTDLCWRANVHTRSHTASCAHPAPSRGRQVHGLAAASQRVGLASIGSIFTGIQRTGTNSHFTPRSLGHP